MPEHNHTTTDSENAPPKTTTIPDGGTNESGTPSLDDVHEMLSSSRRRHVLRTLHEKGPMHKKKLARYVAAIENERDSLDDLEDQEHKRVVVSLHQYNLPPLKKHGFVSWNEATNMVSLGPHSNLALRYLDGITVEDEDDESEVDGSVERSSESSFRDRVANGVNSIF